MRLELNLTFEELLKNLQKDMKNLKGHEITRVRVNERGLRIAIFPKDEVIRK